MIVLKNIPIILFSLIICSHALAVEPRTKPAVQVEGERADFESISVVIRGFWVGNRTITIRGDGSYDFELIQSPQLGNHKVNYQTNYRLRPEHLKRLEELLKATNWLTASGTGRNATDATQYVLNLVRGGQHQTVTCLPIARSKAYDSLIKFIERINRQEWLHYNANYVPRGMRMVVHELESELSALQGEPYSVYAPVLDYQRLVPTFKRTLGDPTDRSTDEVVIAIRLFNYLGLKSQRNHIVALANDHDSSVRKAVANALPQLGGVESVEVLRQMMRNTPDAAAWGLIRLGEMAVPTIIEIFEEPPSAYDNRQMKMVRAYIDNWERVPKPVNEEIIEAVREDLDYRLDHGGGWTSYYKEFLKLTGGAEVMQEVKQGALEGTIIASNGKVAADYEIRLLGTKGSQFNEFSNKEGNYSFSNVPAGLYQLVCSPKNKSHSRLVIEKVRVRENETTVENMSFESRYTFSGKVSYADGRPAVGITVLGMWGWMGSKVKLEVFTKTNGRGRYTLGAPFDVPARNANVGGFGTSFVGPRKQYRNVKPGRRDVNFVLITTESRENRDEIVANANEILIKAGFGVLPELDNPSEDEERKLEDRIQQAGEDEKKLIVKSLFSGGIGFLQRAHDPATALKWFEKIPMPPLPDSNDRNPAARHEYEWARRTYCMVQEPMAKCEIRLGEPKLAEKRIENLIKLFPELKKSLHAILEFELRSALTDPSLKQFWPVYTVWMKEYEKKSIDAEEKPAVPVEGESPDVEAKRRIEFRVLPNLVGSSRYPISPFELPKYVEELKENGLNISQSRGDEYVWLPFELKVGKEQDNLIKQKYNNRLYVLASKQWWQKNKQQSGVQVEREKPQSIIFHGLDLTAVPHTTNSSKLPDLFEQRPLGSKSYHIQKDVTAIYSGLDGTVYCIPRRNIFYVQHDKLGSSTLTYYGPFEGNPVQILNLQPDVQVEGEKKKPPVWLALLPRSPIRSAKELYLYFWGSPLVSDQMKIDSFELEIRSAKDNVRMARINGKRMVTVNTSKGEVLQWSMFRDGLRENMIRRIGPLEDGEYLMAIHVNGIRCSNVAKFTVDSSFDSSNEPTLQVVPLVPAPGKKLQYFGLRATGPTPQDSELTNMALHFPDIIVDGVPRKILARAWSGPVYPLKPGQQHEEILLLKYYKPEIDLSRKHTFKAIVGKYESAPVEIGFDHSLGLAWDEATTTIKSRPTQPPVLEGRVIGPDGKPGIGYRVRLYAGPRRNQCIEYSDKDGKYDFPNVPTGRYKLICQPRGNSEPALTFEQFQIEANKTVVQELSLEGKYAFSGKVTYEDGSPAAGVKIVGRWEIGGGNVFRDLRVTDENGYYELTAPFELARYIGLSIFTPDGTPAQGSYEHIGVMGPRTDVDFVVKRREIHAAIWPEKFARMGGKHPDFQPVPVPEGWDYLRLLQALYKHLETQCKAKLPDCRATLKDEVIKLSFNTRDYNIIRPGNAKRTGMRRNNDRGIGPEPDGLILTVHFSKTAGQFDRPYIIDRSPWTGFISQVYLPDIKLYLNVDIQYGTGINEKLLTDLCAPTSWLKTIFNNFNERTLEQEAWGDAVEKDSQPDVQGDGGSNAPSSFIWRTGGSPGTCQLHKIR